MKNHRFLWLRNRTTDNRKCEKARNIKEKRTIAMFNTVSKPPVAHPSSPSADFVIKTPENFGFPRFFCLFIQKAAGNSPSGGRSFGQLADS